MSMKKDSTISEAEVAAKPERVAPLIIDLGRKKRKQIKALRKGKGDLVDTVLGTMDDLKKSGRVSESCQPVVVVVRERRKTGLKNLWG
jgi:hypothetical protein